MNQVVDPKVIGNRLRALRGNCPRTVTAREIGISYSALSKYESGDKVPNDSTKVKLANHYHATVQELFFDP